MKRLVIDDVRIMNFDADYCRTTDEFRKLFPNHWKQGPHYDEVWLDNDMGFKKGSLDLEEQVKILVNEIEEMAAFGDKLPIDQFVIHTGNFSAGAEMYAALHKWYPTRIERNVEQFIKGYTYEQ